MNSSEAGILKSFTAEQFVNLRGLDYHGEDDNMIGTNHPEIYYTVLKVFFIVYVLTEEKHKNSDVGTF